MKRTLAPIAWATAGLLSFSCPAIADDTEALAKAAQNPIAAMISLPFQNNTTFNVGAEAAYFNLRGYKEFWARNRLEGYALFATLSIPLGSPAK